MRDDEMVTVEIGTVLAWQDALNAGDGEGLVDVSSDDVELTGPDGSARGLTALRAWAADSGLTLRAGRMFVDAGVVVVAEQEVHDADPGTGTRGAAAFRVVQGRVVSVHRHPDLAAALAATGLGDDDEVDVSTDSAPDAATAPDS